MAIPLLFLLGASLHAAGSPQFASSEEGAGLPAVQWSAVLSRARASRRSWWVRVGTVILHIENQPDGALLEVEFQNPPQCTEVLNLEERQVFELGHRDYVKHDFRESWPMFKPIECVLRGRYRSRNNDKHGPWSEPLILRDHGIYDPLRLLSLAIGGGLVVGLLAIARRYKNRLGASRKR